MATRENVNAKQNRQPHIALLMMLKNEEARIQVSLDSVKDVVNSCIIYDTGSTDKTIDIVKRFCNKQCIPFRLKQGEFVDFAVSRNVSLDFADEFDDVDYLLCLDCNDELRDGHLLKQVCRDYLKTTKYTAFHLQQWWVFGPNEDEHKYFNVRMIRPRSGWRYKSPVHEYIAKENSSNDEITRIEGPVLYQNRNLDDGKTGKRFTRDRDLLLKEYAKFPHEPRTLFYLAQTCECLNLDDEAMRFYLERTQTPEVGFVEEIFHSWLRLGNMCMRMQKPWEVACGYFIRAFEYERAEPLVQMVRYYQSKKMFGTAYHFARIACNMSYPHHCSLFIGSKDYHYNRWHLMGIVAFYVGTEEAMKDGERGCIEAIKYAKQDIDTNNLKFYIEARKKKLQEKKK
jgi:glycosyltransferase involved in cell wall biosynthesis